MIYYQNQFLAPKRYNKNPGPFYTGVPCSPGEENAAVTVIVQTETSDIIRSLPDKKVFG